MAVRHRLIATWILIGVVPIVLICVLLAEGIFMLMGQVVSYMATNEVARQNDWVRNTAYSLAWNLNHRSSAVAPSAMMESFLSEVAKTRNADIGAIARTGGAIIVVSKTAPFEKSPNGRNRISSDS